MEDKITSRVCDLMFYIMYASLKIYCINMLLVFNIFLTSFVGVKCIEEACFLGKNTVYAYEN